MTVEALAVVGLHHLDPHEVLAAMDVPARDVFAPFDDAKLFLRRLRTLAFRTVVFSNATYRTRAAYRRDFEDLSLGSLVDEVVSSVDLGYRKPAARMFEAAVEAASCAPSECIVVGDSEEKDVLPAKRMNMGALLVAREGSPSELSQADAIVADLREAAEIIGDWTSSGRKRPGQRGHS
jgi:putative hydrolase of the HAD superfamily